AYLWGDAFLVAPVTDPGVTQWNVPLPAGRWFSFWDDTPYDGNTTISFPVTETQIPVLVRAGAFIPMTDVVRSTDNYSSENLTVHYYADTSVATSSYTMYDDDGRSRTSLADGAYELLLFESKQTGENLDVTLARAGGNYDGIPAQRKIDLFVHNWPAGAHTVTLGDTSIPVASRMPRRGDAATYDAASSTLTVRFTWDHAPVRVSVVSQPQ
ncbi:MAG: DUF5110 domain-containing protein, partial [Gammaproteobacteria bacterium]|nr:DUF5110 domain-containing protein [Gammaproteobacteria bacterium]